MRKRLSLLGAVAVLAGGVVGMIASQGGAHRVVAPPNPSWVAADGRVDPAHLNDAVPLMAADGRPLVCQGKVATVSVRDMVGPPASRPLPVAGAFRAPLPARAGGGVVHINGATGLPGDPTAGFDSAGAPVMASQAPMRPRCGPRGVVWGS